MGRTPVTHRGIQSTSESSRSATSRLRPRTSSSRLLIAAVAGITLVLSFPSSNDAFSLRSRSRSPKYDLTLADLPLSGRLGPWVYEGMCCTVVLSTEIDFNCIVVILLHDMCQVLDKCSELIEYDNFEGPGIRGGDRYNGLESAELSDLGGIGSQNNQDGPRALVKRKLGALRFHRRKLNPDKRYYRWPLFKTRLSKGLFWNTLVSAYARF